MPGPLSKFTHEDHYEIKNIPKCKGKTKKGSMHFFIKRKS